MTRVALYARVSTDRQDADPQLEELRQAAVNRDWTVAGEFVDEMSGTRDTRPELRRLMAQAKRGAFDVVMIWKSDRMARSLRHLLDVMEKLRAWGVEFVSLTEPFDTTTPSGTLIWQIVGAIAEFERSLISERVKAGLEHAKRNGTHVGRPRADVDPEEIEELREQGLSYQQIGDQFGVSKSTIYRVLDRS